MNAGKASFFEKNPPKTWYSQLFLHTHTIMYMNIYIHIIIRACEILFILFLRAKTTCRYNCRQAEMACHGFWVGFSGEKVAYILAWTHRYLAERACKVAKYFRQVAKPSRRMKCYFRQVAEPSRRMKYYFRQVAEPSRKTVSPFR